jgi:hypothetical protein
MNNIDFAALLDDIAQLLALTDTNPFRVKAYENASRLVRGMEEPIAPLVATGAVTSLKGIGKGIGKSKGKGKGKGKLALAQEPPRRQGPPGQPDGKSASTPASAEAGDGDVGAAVAATTPPPKRSFEEARRGDGDSRGMQAPAAVSLKPAAASAAALAPLQSHAPSGAPPPRRTQQGPPGQRRRRG